MCRMSRKFRDVSIPTSAPLCSIADVGGDRRTVHDQRHVIGTDAGDRAQLAQPLSTPLGLVMRGAGDLVDKDAVVRLENEVGVGPADIDAYARHGSPESSRAAAVARPGCTTPSAID